MPGVLVLVLFLATVERSHALTNDELEQQVGYAAVTSTNVLF